MEYKIKPWEHQLKAINLAKDLPFFALFFEMGTGKTGALINIFRSKCMQRGELLKALIFCPPIVVSNWKQEFSKHSNISSDKIVILDGSGKDRVKKFNELSNERRIFITNYESLLMEPLFKSMVAWQPEFLCFDESHKLKDPKAKRSKLAYQLANPKTSIKPYTFILSGSPILNSPMDIFHQFKIMDGGKTFGDNFFVFRSKYFYDKNAGMPFDRHFPRWVPLPGAIEQIKEKMSKYAMSVSKKDCLDLPPMVYQTIKVGMSREQRKLYEDMRKNFIAYINDKAAVAQLAITKALRLQQIASGFVKVVDDEEIAFEDNPKLDALEELLVDLTPANKVLVWAVFRKNYEQISGLCKKLGIDYVEVHGDIPDKQKFLNIDKFNNDKNCRVFIGHPGSGGIGINLVSASYSIFYSRGFSLEHSLQAEARNYRGGSKEAGHERITRIDLVCEKSIDEVVCEALLEKKGVSFELLKNLSGRI